MAEKQNPPSLHNLLFVPPSLPNSPTPSHLAPSRFVAPTAHMGVDEIWPRLAGFTEKMKVSELAGMRVGVDASYMLHAVNGDDASSRLSGMKAWIDMFISVFHFTPLFVFDGTGATDKPVNLKRDENREKVRRILDDLIAHIRTLGLFYVIAPVEADHQLVYLYRKRYIQAILTEDGDLLLHRGVKVIRFSTLKRNQSECNVIDLQTSLNKIDDRTEVPSDASRLEKLLYKRQKDQRPTVGSWKKDLYGMDAILAMYGVMQCDYLGIFGVGPEAILDIIESEWSRAALRPCTYRNIAAACVDTSTDAGKKHAKKFKMTLEVLTAKILTALMRLGKSFVISLPEGEHVPLAYDVQAAAPSEEDLKKFMSPHLIMPKLLFNASATRRLRHALFFTCERSNCLACTAHPPREHELDDLQIMYASNSDPVPVTSFFFSCARPMTLDVLAHASDAEVRDYLSNRRYLISAYDGETVAERRQRAMGLLKIESAPGFIPPDAFSSSGMCLITFLTEIIQAKTPSFLGKAQMTRMWDAHGWDAHIPSILVKAPLLPENPILEFFKAEVAVAKDPHDAAVIRRGIQHIQGRTSVNSLALLIGNEEEGLNNTLISARMLVEPSWSQETQRFGEGVDVATHMVIVILSLIERPEHQHQGGPKYSVKSVQSAACSCYHGGAGKCAHVSALLYTLHSLPLPGIGGKSCTTVRCRWAQHLRDGEVLAESSLCTLRMLAIDKAKMGGKRKMVPPSATPYFHVRHKKTRNSCLRAVEKMKQARLDKATHLERLKERFPMLSVLHHSRVQGSARVEPEVHVTRSLAPVVGGEETVSTGSEHEET